MTEADKTALAAQDGLGQELDLEALDGASGGQAVPQTVIIEEGGHHHHHHHHHHDTGETLAGIAAVLGAVADTAAVINNIQQPQPQPQIQPQPQPEPQPQPVDSFQGN